LIIYTKLTERGIVVVNEIQQALVANIAYHTVSLFSNDSIIYWAILSGVSIVMGAIVYLIERYIAPKLKKKTDQYKSAWANRVIPLSLVGVFVLGLIGIITGVLTRLLPQIIRGRLENVSLQSQSVYERLSMFRDAIPIWKYHPIFGGGAGAWEALYERDQSYPYTSGQTHSFATQLLVETGIVGLISIAAFIIIVFTLFIRYYRKAEDKDRVQYVFYFITPMTILLHSMIDFEMSYVFFEILVFLCLGIITGTQRQQVQIKILESRKQKVQWLASAVLGVTAIVFVVMVSMRIFAVNQLERSSLAMAQNHPLLQVNQMVLNGLKKAPNHPVLLQQIIVMNYQAYEQTQDQQYLDTAQQYLAKLLRDEPYYRPTVQMNYLITLNKVNKLSAIQVMEDAVELYPFEQSYYDQAVTDLITIYSNAYQTNKVAEKTSVGNQIMKLYKRMVLQEQKITDLPDTVITTRSFTMSNIVRFAAGEVMYFQGDYAQAIDILKSGINEVLSKQEDRYVARFYLAALRRQGQDDEVLYQRLIQADAGEAGELSKLLNNSK
jgi:hypothetical protein